MTLRIAYLILAHNDPENVARLAKLLVRSGGLVAIHYDASSSPASFKVLQEALGADCQNIQWPARAKVGWGDWGVVQGTLNGLKALAAAGVEVDYVQLLSGSDYPIRPLDSFAGFLERSAGTDFIECVDLEQSAWVKGGLTHERYQYRHFFNYLQRPKLFDRSVELHRRLKLKRSFPAGLRPHLGSQWWTLTWATCVALLDTAKNGRLINFFKTVWIPDEMFIQSIVGSMQKSRPTSARPLTLYQFSDRGKPVVYSNGHQDYLARQPFFFARKISPHAHALRDHLDQCVLAERGVHQFPDAAFGLRTNEYEEHQAKAATLPANTRLLGYTADPWFSDLSNFRRPQLVVLGASRQELQLIQRLLNTVGRIHCHGVLFDPERIDFKDGAESCAGYNAASPRVRDHSRENFWFDVAKDAHPKMPGFLCLKGTEHSILDRLFWLRGSCFLLVRGNFLRAFGEHVLQSRGAAIDEAYFEAPELMAHYRDECDTHYDWVRDKCAHSKSPLGEIDLLAPNWLDDLNRFLRLALGELHEEAISGGDTHRAVVEMPPIDLRVLRMAPWIYDVLPSEAHDQHRVVLAAEVARGRGRAASNGATSKGGGVAVPGGAARKPAAGQPGQPAPPATAPLVVLGSVGGDGIKPGRGMESSD